MFAVGDFGSHAGRLGSIAQITVVLRLRRLALHGLPLGKSPGGSPFVDEPRFIVDSHLGLSQLFALVGCRSRYCRQ